MGLELCEDASAADWIVHAKADWNQVSRFGPPGFPGYARIPYLPRSFVLSALAHPGKPRDEHAQVCRVVELLAEAAGSSRDCYFALWNGWSDASVPAAPLFEIPHREYFLFRGDLDDLSTWREAVGHRESTARVAFAWPIDQTWCLASDIDPDWMGVGASRSVVAALLADPELAAATADPRGNYLDGADDLD